MPTGRLLAPTAVWCDGTIIIVEYIITVVETWGNTGSTSGFLLVIICHRDGSSNLLGMERSVHTRLLRSVDQRAGKEELGGKAPSPHSHS